jgi:hypothetical protein
MKTLAMAVMVAMTLGLLAAPAAAQFKRGKEEPVVDRNAAKRTAAEERAYKAALERIPDAKEKYDPWGGVVPADSTKKTK